MPIHIGFGETFLFLLAHIPHFYLICKLCQINTSPSDKVVDLIGPFISAILVKLNTFCDILGSCCGSRLTGKSNDILNHSAPLDLGVAGIDTLDRRKEQNCGRYTLKAASFLVVSSP